MRSGTWDSVLGTLDHGPMDPWAHGSMARWGPVHGEPMGPTRSPWSPKEAHGAQEEPLQLLGLMGSFWVPWASFGTHGLPMGCAPLRIRPAAAFPSTAMPSGGRRSRPGGNCWLLSRIPQVEDMQKTSTWSSPQRENRAAHKGKIGPKIGPYIGP